MTNATPTGSVCPLRRPPKGKDHPSASRTAFFGLPPDSRNPSSPQPSRLLDSPHHHADVGLADEKSGLRLKVGVEERGDAAAGIEGGLLVVTDVCEAQDLEPAALVVVHERMPGIRVFLHVVDDEAAFERALKLAGDALVPAVLGAVAGDDGAGCSEERIDVGRELPSIVDAGGGKSATGSEQQSESATHAEADDAGASGAAGLEREPGAGGFDVAEGGSRPGGFPARDQIANDGTDTRDLPGMVEVGGDGEEALGGKPIGLVAEVLAHAGGGVKDDDDGYAAGGGRSRQVAGHLAAGRGG